MLKIKHFQGINSKVSIFLTFFFLNVQSFKTLYEPPLQPHISGEMLLIDRCLSINEWTNYAKSVKVVCFTCWLGGVAWGVCPVGGACPPLLSTTGMLGDVVLWWGLNESCQSTAFLFNTHTLLIPPQPVQREIHQSYANSGIPAQYIKQTKCLISCDKSKHKIYSFRMETICSDVS